MNPLNIIWIYLLAFGLWIFSLAGIFSREVPLLHRLQAAGELTLFPLSLYGVVYGTIWSWQYGWAEAVLGFIVLCGLHWLLLAKLFERHFK
jgi:hypothetical protein